MQVRRWPLIATTSAGSTVPSRRVMSTASETAALTPSTLIDVPTSVRLDRCGGAERRA